MPSLKYDISIEMFDSRCKKCTPSYGAILASAAFLVKFRGLPLETVEVEHSGKMSLVTFLDNNGTMSINLPKCKLSFEKMHIFASGIEKAVKTISIKHENKIALTVPCEDTELFEKGHLCALLASDENADFAMAYSKKDDRISVKPFAPQITPDLTLSATLAAYESIGERKKMTVTCDGSEASRESSQLITVTPSFYGINVSLVPPLMMKFDTPYL